MNIRHFINIVNETVVYHGTPHDVEKFSTTHIGTGEGEQTFGWGLYFASDDAVAEKYRQNLTGDYEYDPEWGNDTDESIKYLKIDGKLISLKTPLNQLTAFQRASIDWFLAKQSKWRAIEEIEDAMSTLPKDIEAYKLYAEELEILKQTEDFSKHVRTVVGNTYTINIIPDDDKFLLWDFDLSKQPLYVQQKLQAMNLDMPETGQKLYYSLVTKLGSPKAASLYLDKNGIPGIRYFDGKSRVKGQGTYNYVVFNDDSIEISH